MSGDGFSSIESDGKHQIVWGRVNLSDFLRENSCSYTGKCLKERTTEGGVCAHCRYEARFDIPKLIDERLREKNGTT